MFESTTCHLHSPPLLDLSFTPCPQNPKYFIFNFWDFDYDGVIFFAFYQNRVRLKKLQI